MKYIFTIIILLVLGYGLYYFSDDSKEPVEPNSVVVSDNSSVIKYVGTHISDLSPEKEVLGGTFYITNITADAGTGTVEYEDGHNAYVANFSYGFRESGEVVITDFRIVE